MTVTIANSVKNDQCDNLVDTLDGGSFIVYDGTPPANASASLSGNSVLLTITLPTPAFGNAGASVDGEADIAGSWTTTASATGTATFFRILTSGAAVVLQGTVSESGGGGDAIVSSTSIVSTETFTVTAGEVVQP